MAYPARMIRRILACAVLAGCSSATVYVAPTPQDFTVSLRILSRQCFPPAGCVVSFRPVLSLDGGALDPSVTYDVTYEVDGGSGGPIVGTLRVTGGEYVHPNLAVTRTSQDGGLTARVTAVVRD